MTLNTGLNQTRLTLTGEYVGFYPVLIVYGVLCVLYRAHIACIISHKAISYVNLHDL